jgi:transketolase
MTTSIEQRYAELSKHFAHWEKTKDIVDQLMDIALNYRQSGHPGGSRSKLHAFLTLLLSGAMRWDIRHPEKRFADRFILSAGHTNPLVYATLAVLSEAMRIKYQQTGDKRYYLDPKHTVFPEDLLTLRRRGGLPGHAEMSGKTIFLKFNTGPSGHGMPAAAGEALALKMAGAGEVKVFAIEGEGGLTPGATHETQNSAWGLGLHNLYFLIDWNDFGIDARRISSVVYGTPDDWFRGHGWRTIGTENGNEWSDVTRTILQLVFGDNPAKVPNAAWFKTQKGRGYGLYENKGHGVPHKMNCQEYWDTKTPFIQKYGITMTNYGVCVPPSSEKEQRAQAEANIKEVLGVLRNDQALIDYLAGTLVALGDSVPDKLPNFKLAGPHPAKDPRITDYTKYPAELFVKPGAKEANRVALRKWGAYVNAIANEVAGRPLFVVSSADLAASTNIAGFAEGFGGFKGFGEYNRDTNLLGALLPQEITEFANAGIAAGMVATNFAENPFEDYNGFYAATSTYGSFVYLHYGAFRLFSQMAQDSEIKLGKIIWVAGHSGPETADDSRTHFGIFAPMTTQLFPKGHIINLFPWEHNEVPVVLGEALKHPQPLIALHLTRPPIEIPDRAALGIPSHFEAAKGAYVIRPYREKQRRQGTVIVQGTSSTANVIKVLPDLERAGLNVKIVAAISRELFDLQPESYRRAVLSDEDWLDSMVITNGSLQQMDVWLSSPVAAKYSMSSDWDNRWRTGGTLEELLDEAHLSPDWIFRGIKRFAEERPQRLDKIAGVLKGAQG